MESSLDVGNEVPFAQFIFDSDVFNGQKSEDEEREWVHAAAERFSAVFKKVAPSCRTIAFEVFRSRRVRGTERPSPLPPGDLWGIQLYLRPK